MSSLLLTIAAIAALCGPRVQTAGSGSGVSSTARPDAKDCQVQMIKCVKAKPGPQDEALVICMQEIK